MEECCDQAGLQPYSTMVSALGRSYLSGAIMRSGWSPWEYMPSASVWKAQQPKDSHSVLYTAPPMTGNMAEPEAQRQPLQTTASWPYSA